MAEFISIRKMREIRDPELFVRCVINDKARLERLDEKRKERLEQARKEAERKAEETKQKESFNTFILRFAIGISFAMAAFSTYVALVF